MAEWALESWTEFVFYYGAHPQESCSQRVFTELCPLDPELDDGRGHDSSNVFGDSGSDDQDAAGGNEDEVMLISRNGQDFSMTGSVISEPIGKSSVESDRRSIEVVPPTP